MRPLANGVKIPEEISSQLARESGRLLGELGVRPDDRKWMRAHAQTLASLSGGPAFARGGILRHVWRWARKAVRAAR